MIEPERSEDPFRVQGVALGRERADPNHLDHEVDHAVHLHSEGTYFFPLYLIQNGVS